MFYGLHPDETWTSSDNNIKVNFKKDKCFEHWHKNVLSFNDCDIFMHSFSTKQFLYLNIKKQKLLLY